MVGVGANGGIADQDEGAVMAGGMDEKGMNWNYTSTVAKTNRHRVHEADDAMMTEWSQRHLRSMMI